MARDNSYNLISNKDVVYVLTAAHGEFELMTAEVSSESENNGAEAHRNAAGNVDGFIFGDSEGGEFTLELAYYEAQQIFGAARLLGVPWSKVPFTLTAKLPLTEPDLESGGEITAYGPERMVVYQGCRITGNVDTSTGGDENRKVTLPCGYIKKKAVGN
jgi:hypothetical protein